MDRCPMHMYPNLDEPSVDFPTFKKELNGETMIWAIIETPEGVENVDAILAIDGIDAIGFGYQDYANAAGLPSDKCPEVKEAQQKVLDAALSHGKPMWWNASDIETVEEMIHKGVRMFLYDSDIVMLDNALRRAARATRELLSRI